LRSAFVVEPNTVLGQLPAFFVIVSSPAPLPAPAEPLPAIVSDPLPAIVSDPLPAIMSDPLPAIAEPLPAIVSVPEPTIADPEAVPPPSSFGFFLQAATPVSVRDMASNVIAVRIEFPPSRMLQRLLVRFLFTALLFWWSVLGTTSADDRGIALLSLFTTMVHTGALGALLTLSPVAWYGSYAATAPALGFGVLEDQQLGGLVMWIPAGLVYLACGLALAARLLGTRREPGAGMAATEALR
jgi:hypothetical protein